MQTSFSLQISDMKFVVLTLVALAALATVQGHSYHLGACPQVEPMPGFDLNKVSWTVEGRY